MWSINKDLVQNFGYIPTWFEKRLSWFLMLL